MNKQQFFKALSEPTVKAKRMNKEEFWQALSQPIFHRHTCASCKYAEHGNPKGWGADHDQTYDYKPCMVCQTTPPNDLMHKDNAWEWDGKTMPDDEY